MQSPCIVIARILVKRKVRLKERKEGGGQTERGKNLDRADECVGEKSKEELTVPVQGWFAAEEARADVMMPWRAIGGG